MAAPNQVVRKFTLVRVNMVNMGSHSVVEKLRQGQGLALARDPKDPYDTNAVFVVARTVRGNVKIGYVAPQLAAEIAPIMDAGVRVIARRAMDARYGVCELAYIPPPQVEQKPTIADLPAEVVLAAAPSILDESIMRAIAPETEPQPTTESPHDEPAPEAAPDSP